MTEEEFQACMTAMAGGDRQALKAVYHAYLKLIFAVVYDTVRQREEAEDITSEFFIKLFHIAGTYRAGNGHKKWLVTIAKNMAIDRIRKTGRETPAEVLPEPEQEQPEFTEQIVNRVTLKQAVAGLKPDEREILDLKAVGQFTFAEIAQMTGRPMGTVTWLYNSAIQKLRRCRQWI